MKGLLDPSFSHEIGVRTQKTIQRFDLRPGMSILDANCGPGRLMLPIAAKVGRQGEVTVIDIQEGMLSEARERARKAEISNICFILTGLGDGRLEHDYFDRAVLVTVLGEIPPGSSSAENL